MKETGSGSKVGSDKFYPELEVETKNSKGEEAEQTQQHKISRRVGSGSIKIFDCFLIPAVNGGLEAEPPAAVQFCSKKIAILMQF